MTSDFDPESTQDRAKRIHDLLADKGAVLGTGTVVVPGPRGEPEASDAPTSKSHSVSVVLYLDAAGHVHAVTIDEVHTHSAAKGHQATLEILSDVVIS